MMQDQNSTTSTPLQHPEYGTPWYRNFWPWFIVVMLAVSIIGSLVTVAIAYRHRDVDVRQPIPESASAAGVPRVLAG
jgi:uncharacterized membrane protein YadS